MSMVFSIFGEIPKGKAAPRGSGLSVWKESVHGSSVQAAEASFSAMRTLEKTVIVHMDGKHGSVPPGRKGSAARGADVLFGRNITASSDQPRESPYSHRYGDHPPCHVVLLVKPIHGTGGQE